ncbi:MAG: hypothetical protein K6L76_13960 [Agarilytica sp.]
MNQYVIVYLGGNPPKTPEEGQQHFAKYKAWLGSLGDTVVSPANPLKHTHTLEPGGIVKEGGQTTMSGYTIIQAENIEAALDIAKACPFMDIGGTLEVSELMKMNM